MDAPLLCRFRSIRPRFKFSQVESLEWLVDAHTRAEVTARAGAVDEARFRDSIAKLVRRCACSPAQIASRGIDIPDGNHRAWSSMIVYDLTRWPHGAGTAVRTEVFRRCVDGFFDRVLVEVDAPPSDIIHVTCTGYVSPSGAQRLVAKRGWGERTRVVHAYHMGCYASMPAVRIAAGLLDAPRASGSRNAVEVAHTELCSLQIDPLCHSAEQVVVQSLFADGLIHYAVSHDAADRANERGLRLLASCEAILPDSGDSMQWLCSDFGMRMVLARDVPERVARALPSFLRDLFGRAGRDFTTDRDGAFYAVHPGGPRIIDGVRDALELSEEQVGCSRAVLRDHGNMSSATLPHIWARIVDAPEVAAGALVVSLAFGPGLTLCGALFEKT